VLKWIRSLGFWGMFVGAMGALNALIQNDWGIVGLGIVFVLLSYGWYWLFGKFTT
jgi:hypothetical protein